MDVTSRRLKISAEMSGSRAMDVTIKRLEYLCCDVQESDIVHRCRFWAVTFVNP